MALTEEKQAWLSDFTAGAVAFAPSAATLAADPLRRTRDALRAAQAREAVGEAALKDAMLATVFKALDAKREELREAFDLVATSSTGKGRTKDERLMDERGATHGFEAAEANKLVSVPKGVETAGTRIGTPNPKQKDDGAALPVADEAAIRNQGKMNATLAMAFVTEQKDYLAGRKVERSVLDPRSGLIVTEAAPLFTDAEIEAEVYTPLVRDLVMPDTLISNQFSATQKMIDGSNAFYVKECQEKGKRPVTGAVAFAKGAVQVGAAVATAIISGLGPVADGAEATKHSGALSKAEAARALAITNGVAALLTTGIDVADAVDEARRSGDFPQADYRSMLNGIGTGIGKIVSATTGNVNLGVAVTDGICAGSAVLAVAPKIKEWRDKGGKPPVGDIIGAIGEAIARSFAVKSDLTDDAKTSTDWSRAGSGVSLAFTVAAKAAESRLDVAIRKGDWKTVFANLLEAGKAAAGTVPNMARFAEQYNAIDGVDPKKPDATPAEIDANKQAQQLTLIRQMDLLATQVDALGGGADKLLDKTAGEIAKLLHAEGKAPAISEKQAAAMDAKLAEAEGKARAELEAAQRKELAGIQATLDAEKKEYQAALNCLGSTNPDDAEYKSIAKLIAQIERDRAIWDGLFAIFGAGLGGAGTLSAATALVAEVVPALKIAGQLLKYVQNVKAAADRLDAWLDWRDARRDAKSAVSPYASSIQNFVSNQGGQLTHYTVQASANAVQALLAVGGFTPYAPAFAAAGSAVAAAATAEELVYKFHKQMALRKAWAETREALDPRNRGNRRMALLVRKINPTLAKYTIAYGALVEKSPIAITAMNRVGLDRETLARAGDKVVDVKNYLQALYPDDGTVLGDVAAKPGETKVPAPALLARTWALSVQLWTAKSRMADVPPPSIVANLVVLEPLAARPADGLDDAEGEAMLDALRVLEAEFRSFKPRTDSTAPLEAAQRVIDAYADLASVTLATKRMELA